MKHIEDKLGEVEGNQAELKELDKKVEKVEEALRKKDYNVEKKVKGAEFRMCDEMRERKQGGGTSSFIMLVNQRMKEPRGGRDRNGTRKAVLTSLQQ